MRNSVALACLLSCINNPVPDERTLRAEELETWTHGLWIVVEPRRGEPFGGELLSADDDGVAVLAGGRAVRVHLADVEKMTIAAYRTHEGRVALWGAAGTLSTVTHGMYLLLSAPVWVVTSLVTPVVIHDRPVMQWPRESIDKLRPFARFPQGMPPGWSPELDRPAPWPKR